MPRNGSEYTPEASSPQIINSERNSRKENSESKSPTTARSKHGGSRKRKNPTTIGKSAAPKKEREFVLAPKDIKLDESYKRADYVELLCLINEDGIITRSEINDRFGKEDDLDDLVEPFDDEDSTSEFEDIGSIQAEINDQRELIESDWLQQIRFRSTRFGNFYPFAVLEDGVISRNHNITEQHRLYILMLAASNLKYFSSKQKRLTASFERLCADALQKYLPDHAEVHNFGAGLGKMRVSTKYNRGNLFERIKELGIDLKLSVIAKASSFSPKDAGDSGLDLVAWIPANDNTSGMIILFGQCACTDNWVSKQHDSGPAEWSNKIIFTSPYINTIFIPICFREATGEWHNINDIKQTILFDRLRILNLLGDQYKGYNDLTAVSAVEEILSLREGHLVVW